MNIQFAKSVDSFVTAEKKQGNAFADLVMFAVSVLKEVVADAQYDHLCNVLKSEETGYKSTKGIESMPTAYRSSKSVITNAVKAGVALVDDKGKAKGKSEIEKECKELAGDGKPEIQKFTSTMATAMSIFAKLDTLHDVQAAKVLIRELADACIKAEAELISKAAESK